LFGWGFFCVAILPAAGFVDVGYMRYSLVADHYQHMAIIGVIAIAAAGWCAWRSRRGGRAVWVTTAVAILAAGTFAFLTWRQSGLYRDAATLYNATLSKNPDCWMSRLYESMEHYQRAVRINPEFADGYFSLALVYAGLDQPA
jgi:protein O-mannosyl-transferase